MTPRKLPDWTSQPYKSQLGPFVGMYSKVSGEIREAPLVPKTEGISRGCPPHRRLCGVALDHKEILEGESLRDPPAHDRYQRQSALEDETD